MENLKNATIIYGLPGDYLSNRMLDDMDVDLVERKTDSFLDYLAQTNRNYQTIIFKQIGLPTSSNTMTRTYLKSKRTFDETENKYFISTMYLYYLQSGTPRYFQYSLIGKLFGWFFRRLISDNSFEFKFLKEQISQQTPNPAKEVLGCLKNQMQKYNLPDDHMEIVNILAISAEEKASYMTYKKWIQSNGVEALPGSNYTPHQLFWIAGTYCHVPSPNSWYSLHNDVNYYSNVSLVSKFNNPEFAKDFKCPLGSETNPAQKCSVVL
ncbi:hypothetical protein ILUMI_01202 [Ignelater luminosus]|uniref:Peptidase M13 C-terminal domain-containing protein n=1 Tax=Ignelater luminosus TaxID=2038154 RepID=A0A8K0DF27_IGNLU|nr:hypothetical protein ILUMI_01202 [Ignelater luminosus]